MADEMDDSSVDMSTIPLSGGSNILNLTRRLRQELLFCKAEQHSIKELNEKILRSAEILAHTFWTSRQHHLNLDKLITDNSSGAPTLCCQRANVLESIQFVDGFKVLGYQESLYGTFLQSLRSNPTLVAACLAYGDKLGLTSAHNVVDSLVLGLYGNSVIAEDHQHLLELMQTLMLLQLANTEHPRRVLQKGNAAFCIVYKLFTDSLMSSKLFLTAALHSPVMNVILSTDLLLESDPNKILDCYSAEEIEKRFGKRDNPEFDARVKQHLQRTEEQLVDICMSFVESLHSNLYCFPHSLGWIISRTYNIIKVSDDSETHSEALAICADLLMQSYICPAIVNPELYGISGDIPITEVTRFNLMQVAQFLQVLALSSENETGHKYSRFDKSRIRKLLDSVINSCSDDEPPRCTPITEGFVDCAAFLTPLQLNNIITFLTEIQASNVHGVDQSTLSEVLSHLPANPPEALASLHTTRRTDTIVANDQAADDDSSSSSTPSKSKSKSGDYDSKNKGKDRGHSSASSNDSQSKPPVAPNVMAISLNRNGTNKPPGLLTETEVMENHQRFGLSDVFDDKTLQQSSNVPRGSKSIESMSDKRLRFSAFSTDMSEMCEGTIENSSQASNSSIDDLDQPESMQADDTSSFHGTSSHGNQEEEEDEDEAGEDLESAPHTNNDEALKALERKLPTSRESIEDKMRKFEIRPQGVRFGGTFVAPGNSGPNYGDTRSETWSTDAYLSDSEAPTEQEEANESAGRLQEIAEDPDPARQPPRGNAAGTASPYLAIISRDDDSRSDVWSVEVLPSDSEPPDVKPEDRLQELESESNAGAEDERDPLEDSRSRASTPGLSAASGVSGTSGLSLVSDNIHARGGGMYAAEEQGSSSEKSYGKGTNSVSPDMEEMMNNQTKPKVAFATTDGSNTTMVSISPVQFVNSRQQTIANNIDVTTVASHGMKKISIKNQTIKRENSSNGIDRPDSDKKGGDSRKNDNKNKKPSNNFDNWSSQDSNSLLNANIGSDFSAFDSKKGDSELKNESNSNTIKRSPFKQSSSSSSDKTASDEVLDTKASDKQTNANLKTANEQDLLMSFDPLVAKENKNMSEKLSNGKHSPSEAWPTQKSTPVGGARPKEIEHTTPEPTSKPVDRKKSWWKGPRFTSKRKSPTNAGLKQSSSSSDIMSAGKMSPSVSSPDANKLTASVDRIDDSGILHSSPIKAPEEDIMEKYMRKAASATKVDSKKSVLNTSVPNDLFFNLDDPDSRNKSSLTSHSDTINTTPTLNSTSDGHMSSATSEGTVTTTAKNISGASNDNYHDKSNDKVAEMNGHPNEINMVNNIPVKPSSEAIIKNAVKKIRLILSTTDPSPDPFVHDQLSMYSYNTTKDVNHNHRHHSKKKQQRNQLLSFLRQQLSEAINMQQHARVTQLHETIRCVRSFSDDHCSKAIKRLWLEYKQRSVYIEYLVRTKQSLLTTLSYIEHLIKSAQTGEETCKRYFIAVCVRLFLRKKDNNMKGFRAKFSQLTAADEKVTLVNSFLSWLYGQLSQDPMFEGTCEAQLSDAEKAVERSVFCCVYKLALFPNGDGDQLRDQLYHDHIVRLRKVITPHHQALQIPEKYLFECPWRSAQNEISSINAYRTPREKVACVLRCSDIILNLLKMADESNVPGADDFTPVLVYIIIMANPLSLLSTVQYVSSFLGNDLTGEEAYWWMQFTAATEFIKTIDERK